MGSHMCHDCGAQVVAAPGVRHACPVRERKRLEALTAAQEPCVHMDFITTVTIVRLTEVEDGPVTAFAAKVTMACQACSEPFVFIGAPVGLLPTQPTVSADGKEMHLPVRPASRPDMIGRLGYVLRVPGEPSSSNSRRPN